MTCRQLLSLAFEDAMLLASFVKDFRGITRYGCLSRSILSVTRCQLVEWQGAVERSGSLVGISPGTTWSHPSLLSEPHTLSREASPALFAVTMGAFFTNPPQSF